MDFTSITGGSVELVSNGSNAERSLKCLRIPIPKTMDNKIIINQVLPEKTFTFPDKPGPSNFQAVSPVDEPPKHPWEWDDPFLVKKVNHPASV